MLLLIFVLSTWVCFSPSTMALFHRHCCWLLYFEKFWNSSPWTIATTLWDRCKHWKYVSTWSYYHYKSSFLGSEQYGFVPLPLLLIVIFWSFSVIPFYDLNLLLTSFSLYIKKEQSFGNLYLYNYIYQENKVLATDIYITIYPKRTNIWQLVYLQVSIISKLGCD